MTPDQIRQGHAYRRAGGPVRLAVVVQPDPKMPSGSVVLWQQMDVPGPLGMGSADLGVFAANSEGEVPNG